MGQDPDNLIRRLEAEGRLDRAAWEAFHDPWETPPARTPNPDPGAPVEPEAPVPLSLETIDRFLASEEYSVWSSTWDSRMVFYNYGPRSDRVVRATYSIQGKQQDIFVLRIVSDRRVDPPQFELAWRLCSEYGAEYRYMRAFLEVPSKPEGWDEDPEAPAWNPSGLLVLDMHVPLGAGITQSAFDLMVKEAIGSSWTFWRMARERYGL